MRGFAMAWLLMLTAVVALLAAAITPSVITSIDHAKVISTAQTLTLIDSAINAFEPIVKTGGGNTQQFPGRVSELSIPITAASKNSCGNAMNANAAAKWATAGPFIPFFADTNGLVTPIGRLQDVIERVTPPASNPLIIRIPGVSADLVRLLDDVIDDGDGGAAGKVFFLAPVNDTTSVLYHVTPRQNNKC